MKTQLFLSTIAFGIAFALWGSVAGAAPLLKKLWGLTPFQTAILVALPVILGSLGRIPMGLLTDRLGPRLMMSGTLAFAGFCALGVAFGNPDYLTLLGISAFMGVSGTAFVIGVAHIAPWCPKSQQGSALGIFGMGNLGQSFALLGIPWLALFGSWKTGFFLLGLLSLTWALLYFLKAKESPKAPRTRKSFTELLQFFRRSPAAWVLSLYYFLTFGGFVALSIYLPTLLKDQFLLSPREAGMASAGFVILATFMRPLGGWLSDRWGAQKILFLVFLEIGISTLFLMSQSIGLFYLGIFIFALCAGLGNGGVFKLVPYYFSKDTGTVTGLVGAAGGMGGFFPPLVMAFSLQTYGNYLLGWTGLLAFSVFCLAVLWKSILAERARSTPILAGEEATVS